jgi:hypothetical protein
MWEPWAGKVDPDITTCLQGVCPVRLDSVTILVSTIAATATGTTWLSSLHALCTTGTSSRARWGFWECGGEAMGKESQ